MFGHDDQQQPVVKAPVSGAPAANNGQNTPAAHVDAPDGLSDDVVAAADNLHGDDLLAIKQDALKQLSPLVSHLDQTPEEKFRTTMMMIQAADDQNLIKDAYEAAQNISDEKARAQALLDIVNEINYFTQQHNNS
jgi:hypothetical protein